jgi:hypothetical protein
MRLHAMAVLMMLLGWLTPGGSAHADTTVRVVETYPSGEQVTLGRHQNFYLRLAYTTDKPTGIWANPYFHGKPANAGSNPSQRYSGSGEAFGWFFLMNPGDEVDEVRITAGDGSRANTPVLAVLPVHVVGGDMAVDVHDEPAWVGEMKQRAKQAQKESYDAAMNASSGPEGTVLLGILMLAMSVIGMLAFAAPAWGLWRWRGGWRVAAAVPAVLMAFVIWRIMFGVARDPTSHNLWPFEILQAGVLSLVVMGVLALARKFSGASRR